MFGDKVKNRARLGLRNRPMASKSIEKRRDQLGKAGEDRYSHIWNQGSNVTSNKKPTRSAEKNSSLRRVRKSHTDTKMKETLWGGEERMGNKWGIRSKGDFFSDIEKKENKLKEKSKAELGLAVEGFHNAVGRSEIRLTHHSGL